MNLPVSSLCFQRKITQPRCDNRAQTFAEQRKKMKTFSATFLALLAAAAVILRGYASVANKNPAEKKLKSGANRNGMETAPDIIAQGAPTRLTKPLSHRVASASGFLLTVL